MFRNYIKIAFRNIKRHKAFSFINIAGLAIGMVCCILIMLWVANELSYDKFNQHKDRIYRLCVDFEAGSHMVYPLTMPSAAPLLIKEFPEVVNAARLEYPRRGSVKYKNEVFQETGVCHGDNSLFEVFSFPFLAGDPKTALLEPYTVVITESISRKYFKKEDPLGKTLEINGTDEYTITGVIKDIPDNSHFRFNVMCSYETLYSQNRSAMENWFHIQFFTYLLLGENADISQFEQKLPQFIDKYMGNNLRAAGASLKFFLQPLKRIHLHSSIAGEIAPQGDIKNIYLFTGIAFFVLLIGCVNFINLSTARSSRRALEIGIRKTIGAGRLRLIFQFLLESIVLSILALLFALVLVEVLQSKFHIIFDKELNFNVLSPLVIILGLIGLPVLIGILAGSYPAFYLSEIKPVTILRDGFRKGSYHSYFRNALIIFQFAISIILIIATLTIFNQIHFMKNNDPGFKKKDVIVIPEINKILRENSLETLRQKFWQIPEIVALGSASLVPGRGIQRAVLYPEGFPSNQPQMGEKLFVDSHYIPTMEIELTAGRNFSENFPADQGESVIINEAAVKEFGWDEPIGKTFLSRAGQGEDQKIIKLNVIGVVKDFHSNSLHNKIEPLIFYYDTNRVNFLIIKVAPGDISQTLDMIKQKWKEIFPDNPFNYFFLDESLDRMYGTEDRFGNIALYFCLLTVFIGCLGLFGLTAFIIERRTKEIGIRKVMGASGSNITKMISKEYIILIIISNVIAWPLAFFGLNKWLQNFAYKIDFSIWLYIISGFIALLIAIITVSIQTIKAANENPVNALKYE
ncbi:MAG: ABC transporter permease [Armatimonadetes bacterium]|nr:ABC transporter permease [Armatimonadota bacterium]